LLIDLVLNEDFNQTKRMSNMKL